MDITKLLFNELEISPKSREINLVYTKFGKKILIETSSKTISNEDILLDIIEYGKYLISLEEIIKKKELYDILNKHFNSLKAIYTLIKCECQYGLEELARCYLEFSIQLIFICKDKELIDKKLLAYEYFFEKSKLDILSKNKVNKILLEDFKVQGLEVQTESHEEFLKGIENIENECNVQKKILENDKYKIVIEEIKRLKYLKKRKNKKKIKDIEIKNFYECFSGDNETDSFFKLCNICGYGYKYVTSYRLFSKKIHGVNTTENSDPNIVLREVFYITFDLFKILCNSLLTPEDFKDIRFVHSKIQIQYKFLPLKEREKVEQEINKIIQFYNIKNEQILKKEYFR